MLTDDQLIVELRKLVKVNQRLPVLLLLAHVPQPAKTRAITDKAAAIGFRPMRDWNVSDILAAAEDPANLVVKREGGWVLLEPGTNMLKAAGVDLGVKRTSAPSDSVVPRELFEKARRSYIDKVVTQINGSYDHEYYDGCAVMCRRLVETLIIEAYEAHGRAGDIKGSDGYFHMLNGLLTVLFKDAKFNLARNSIKGLDALKALGDKSAHSRRFNAVKPDIDQLRADLRAAVQELLHHAKLN